MIPRFQLERPRSLGDAIAAFSIAPDDSAYLAGGTELLQVMKMGLASVGRLVDLKAVPDLRGISIDDEGGLVIGALTTHREIERSDVVRAHTPALAALAGRVGNVRVRSTGTLGGNLAFAEPHSDPATLLLACGATIRLVGPAGERRLPIDQFVVGPLLTARERDEVLVDIRLPARAPGAGHAYERLAFFERPAVSVAVSATVIDGAISAASVAVGSITDAPSLVEEAGEALIGTRIAELDVAIEPIARRLAEGIDAFDDLNGSADYKRHLAGLLIARATSRAVGAAA